MRVEGLTLGGRGATTNLSGNGPAAIYRIGAAMLSQGAVQSTRATAERNALWSRPGVRA